MSGYESEDEVRSNEERLLHAARNGKSKVVEKLLQARKKGDFDLNINCRGSTKGNLGWSPLHLASYFGHTEVVTKLLENGADVNVLNDAGDSPLHKAAFTSRVESVLLLLRYDADVHVKNSENCTPKQTAKSQDIIDLIAAAEAHEEKKKEDQLLRLAREGDTEGIQALLTGRNPPNLNCCDTHGNTALHNAALRGRHEAVILLLQNGCDTSLRNKNSQMAYHVALDSQTARLLDVRPIKDLQRDVPRFEGPLARKIRFMGWRPFWVVVDKGVMSFFKTRGDATTGTRRKACKYLDNSRVECQRDVGHIFRLYFADETVFTCAVEPNLTATVTRQKWENVLGDHIAYATRFTMLGMQDVSDENDEIGEEALPLGSLQDMLRESEAHQAVLEKQISKVASAISSLANDKHNNKQVSLLDIRQQLNCVLNTSQEMYGSLQHCLTVFTQEDQIRKLQLKQEQEKSRVLQASLHVLAKEHLDLEKSVGHGGHISPSSMGDSDQEEEFFDCDGDETASQKSSEASFNFNMGGDENLAALATDLNAMAVATPASNGVVVDTSRKSKWGGRCSLPVPMFSRNNFSVWTFLKQCIGKELSKITMPVIFNEPLSFLQRMAEYHEYSQLINQAVNCPDPLQRFEHVVAFAVSSAAANWERIGKPFNPLLGETYEFDRSSDLGYRFVCEQVSHHPPVSAFHVDSPAYTFHGSVHPKLKFWGKSVEVTPKGLVTLHLKELDESYTWQYINCCVHNIIVGKLWIEHYGSMEIVNQKTKEKCVLNFKPSGWFGKDLHKVEGFIFDANKKKKRAIFGKWVEALYSFDVQVWERYLALHKNKTPPSSESSAPATPPEAEKDDEEPMPVRGSSCNLSLQDQRVLWTADSRPPESQQYYNFTHFAMMLNELQPGMQDKLAPTDSRLRPDMRKLEQGDLDRAAAEKHRMEEKQRAVRKERKKSGEEWKPRWFKQEMNKRTKKEEWVFQNEYWNKNWERCPDIF